MLTNSIKPNWTLEELQWQVQPAERLAVGDGLVGWFLRQVASDPTGLQDPYIKRWHNAAMKVMHNLALQPTAHSLRSRAAAEL